MRNGAGLLRSRALANIAIRDMPKVPRCGRRSDSPKSIRLWCAVLCCLCGAAYSAAAASVTASLDRDTITLGESARLQLSFEGDVPRAAPAIPAITGLQIGYIGQSSGFSAVNGVVSQS